MLDCNDILLLDIGNTRLHWRYGSLQGSHDLSNLKHATWPFAVRALTHIYYCAVAKSDRWHDMPSTFPEAQWFRCEHPDQSILGTQYDATQLGIDRWLAMVGAQYVQSITEPCLVVDVGTALTLDVLIDQQHRGGWICPGFKTWLLSITEHTNIAVDFAQQPSCELGRNTRDAISNGWLRSTCDMIHQTLEEQGLTHLVITGGHAEVLRPYFVDALYCDNLVLDGLAHWAKVCIKTDQIS